jgi:hypothetical protein
MGNMSYCQFRNTEGDLDDCFEDIDEPLSRDEHKARIRMIKLCATVIIEWAGAKTIEEAVDWAKTLPCDEPVED